MTAAVMVATTGIGSAQTVYLRNAPAGSNVEVVVNAASAGKGAVDSEGEAKIPFTLPEGKTEMDSNVFVDKCDAGKLRKVLITDRVRQPPPPAEGCDRREVPGIYWVRPVNTIVVDVGGVAPSLLLVRGSYTPPKPAAEGSGDEEHPSKPLPTGLLMFGGGAYSNFRDAGILFCGNAPCTARTTGFTYTFGVDVWLTRFVGVEGGYLHPHEVSASGGDGTFTFKSTLDSDVWTVAGKLGAQAGVVRIYGKGGMNYHQATTKTAQTIDNVPQVFQYKTTGWSWIFGGGMEAWLGQRQRLAIYSDAGIMRIKGDAESGGEAKIDDRLKYIAVGVKLRLSR
ncbi:MAG TPA: outer membrane beta-barrel protein [Vicinamibacterales bacterium]|nr:outer membrane beta-barrel protein [Vicinamibacterales bacterium]